VSGASSKQGPENQDDVIDKINHLTKCFDDHLTLKDARLVDHYRKSDLLVLIRFRIRLIDEEFIACFQREQVVLGSQEQRQIRHGSTFLLVGNQGSQAPRERRANVQALETGADCHQQAVLIHNVEAVQLPEGVVPSLVWLDRVDRVDRVLPHALDLSQLSGFVFLGGIEDREIDVIERTWLGRPDQDELVGQMVESASQVLQDFPSDHVDHCWHLTHADEVVNELSRLRIALGADYVRVGGEERLEDVIQLSDVVLGPFDLSLHALQSISRGHGNQGYAASPDDAP